MQMFYSAATGGFYCTELHGDAMPEDAIEISGELYETLKGQSVVTGEDGQPALYVAPPAALVVPHVLTMRQARLALLSAGILSNVAPALAALPSPQKEAAQIEWEYAATVDRASPLVTMLASTLGLGEGMLDALFTAGSAL